MRLNIFNKTEIVGVQGPVKRHALVHGELKYVGYDVFVCYRNSRGREYTKCIRFADDNNSLYTQYAGPLDAAQQYVNGVRAKIEKNSSERLEQYKKNNTVYQIRLNSNKAHGRSR